jgi:hypothetical protein
VEKIVAEGHRYLVVVREPIPSRLDLYVLCRILNWIKFLPSYIQAEVWTDRPVAHLYYKLQNGNCYVGPSRRLENGRWVVYGRLYCIKQTGGRYVATDGESSCR